MSDAGKKVTLSMKVMVNKEKTKVLFGIVDNNLADILLSFLTLPLGRIIRLLEKHYGDNAPIIGSLTGLYKGLANLDSSHFWTEEGKLMLLDPRSSLADECSKLKININDTQPQILFRCEELNCRYKKDNVSMYFNTQRCSCGKLINRHIDMGWSYTQAKNDINSEVFTLETMSYLISEDLRMLPNGTGSITQFMKELGIMDTDGAEEMTVTIGFNEIMELLKGSLLSRTPLSDFILQKSQMNHSPSITKSEPFNLSPEMKEGTMCSSKKMKVKAMIQKSTNKFLFIQAQEDFVDFLFSFLTIPLGTVESLLSSNASLGKMDNLHRSIANLYADKYLKTASTKDILLNPVLPPMYLSKNQILSLTEQKSPILYYNKKYFFSVVYPYTYNPNQSVYIKDPKGKGSYVKGPKMLMVTDDLTVTPFCMLSTVSTLNGLKIQFSDVEERELDIGLEECLSILKASLISRNALTDGLIHIMKKQPKQEH